MAQRSLDCVVVKADKHQWNTQISSDDCTFWNLLIAAVLHIPHGDLLDLLLCNLVVCKCPHCGVNNGLSYL